MTLAVPHNGISKNQQVFQIRRMLDLHKDPQKAAEAIAGLMKVDRAMAFREGVKKGEEEQNKKLSKQIREAEKRYQKLLKKAGIKTKENVFRRP